MRKPQRKIIAVTGLPGSGKSEVIEYLMEMRGWPKVYFGEVTFDELARCAIAVSEASERSMREELRRCHGPLVYADRMIEKIRAIKGDEPVLVESLYSWEEYLRFCEVFGDAFRVIAVHASPEIRYARLAVRPIRPLTAEEAWGRDKSQIENLHQAGPIAMADHLIVNEGSKGDLRRGVEEAIRRMK